MILIVFSVYRLNNTHSDVTDLLVDREEYHILLKKKKNLKLYLKSQNILYTQIERYPRISFDERPGGFSNGGLRIL